MDLKVVILWLIISTFLPCVYAEETEEFTWVWEKGISPITAITAIDLDSDGIIKSVVYGDQFKVYTIDKDGDKLWEFSTSINSPNALAAFDYDSDGYSDDVIIGSDKVYAFDSEGNELWSYDVPSSVSSVAAVDFDRDGNLSEIVAGGPNAIYALDSEGNSIWNYSGVIGSVRKVIAVDFDGDGKLDDVAAMAGKTVYGLNSDGGLRFSEIFSSNVNSIVAVALDGDGRFDDVLAGTIDGSIDALDSNGNLRWEYNVTTNDERPILLYAADINSDGIVGEVLVRAGNVYAIDSNRTKIWSKDYRAEALNPIDLDGDGRLDDAVVGTPSKIYVVSSDGDSTEVYTASGADTIVSVAFQDDGIRDDIIAANNKVFTIFGLKHTSAVTPPPEVEEVDTDADGISDEREIILGLDPLDPDSDDDGLKDGEEIALGTHPLEADSDDDGIIDSEDPDPLVPEITTNIPPTASIDSPTNGSVYTEGDAIRFLGSGVDSDGTITSYQWNSSIDGTIGSTSSFNSSTLSIGNHTITLITTDDDGATGVDTVVITINPKPTVQPSQIDSDNDGLTDEEEIALGSDPNNPDTDGDGIIDSKDPNVIGPQGKGLFEKISEKKLVIGIIIILIIAGVVIYIIKKRSEGGVIGLQEW